MTEEEKQPEVDEHTQMVIVARHINAMMQRFSKRNISPDMVAFMMLSSGLTLLISNNRFNPLSYGEILAAAMASANQAICLHEDEDEDDEEETKH
jgi:hypothetical protein